MKSSDANAVARALRFSFYGRECADDQWNGFYARTWLDHLKVFEARINELGLAIERKNEGTIIQQVSGHAHKNPNDGAGNVGSD